jgi:hypothetical protein
MTEDLYLNEHLWEINNRRPFVAIVCINQAHGILPGSIKQAGYTCLITQCRVKSCNNNNGTCISSENNNIAEIIIF